MPTHPLHGLHWTARLSAWQRQALALAPAVMLGLAVAAATPASAETAWLAAWLLYGGLDLAIIWHLVANLDAHATRRRAQWIDPSAPMFFALVTLASCASVVTVALAVGTAHSLQAWARWGHLVLAMAALGVAWLLIQTAFALHYARRYYRPGPAAGAPEGGLVFPGGEEPDYLDFVYFAAVVGMTSQVSDVSVSSRAMRRLTLLHGLLSFAFNLVVLAMAVNVFASSLA